MSDLLTYRWTKVHLVPDARCIDGQKFTSYLMPQCLMDGDQIGGLTAAPGSVIDNFTVNFIGSETDNSHYDIPNLSPIRY
jgi:hypothetical protein